MLATELYMMRKFDIADFSLRDKYDEDSATLKRLMILARVLGDRLHVNLHVKYGYDLQDSAHIGEIDLRQFLKIQDPRENLQLRISGKNFMAALWEHDYDMIDDVRHIVDDVLRDHGYVRLSDAALYLPYDGAYIELHFDTWMDRFFDYIYPRS